MVNTMIIIRFIIINGNYYGPDFGYLLLNDDEIEHAIL